MPKLLIFDAFTLLIPEKTVANYALLRCKTFNLKIWVCKIFDKFHVWFRSGRSVEIYDWVFSGIFFTLGYSWVYLIISVYNWLYRISSLLGGSEPNTKVFLKSIKGIFAANHQPLPKTVAVLYPKFPVMSGNTRNIG